MSDHPYRILIIGGSESGKTNALLTLIKNKIMVIKVLSVKVIHILKIQMKQNIIILLT